MRSLINLALFQMSWFACILGAAHGYAWLGPLVVCTAFTLHLLTQIPQASRRTEVSLMLRATILGLFIETALIQTQWITYIDSADPYPPLWLIALWPAFAMTLRHSLAWLQGRWILATLLGAIAGPLSYIAGAQLGAATLMQPLAVSLYLAIAWAITMPLLAHWSKKELGAQHSV